jgi:hypothetical protein
VPVQRFEICVDCTDRGRVRPWWQVALEWREVPSPGGEVELEDPASGTRLWFQEVPEAKILKNRVHLDVYLPQAEVAGKQARLTELGGSVLARHDNFVVVADPEGNELCLCWG